MIPAQAIQPSHLTCARLSVDIRAERPAAARGPHPSRAVGRTTVDGLLCPRQTRQPRSHTRCHLHLRTGIGTAACDQKADMPRSSPDSHAETLQRAATWTRTGFLPTSGRCLPPERIARRSPMFVAAANDVSAVADPPVPQCKGLADKRYLTETAVLLPTPRTHPRRTFRPQQPSRHNAGPKSLRRSLHSHDSTGAAVFESPKSGDATSHRQLKLFRQDVSERRA
jgi:hypothetical protein